MVDVSSASLSIYYGVFRVLLSVALNIAVGTTMVGLYGRIIFSTAETSHHHYVTPYLLLLGIDRRLFSIFSSGQFFLYMKPVSEYK
jgi:hypothetical protein